MKLNKRNKIPEINITPLVDVMLVLLVIFMAVSPTMNSGIDVNLPVVKYAKKDLKKDDNFLRIVILKDKILINQKEVSFQEFRKELSKHDLGMQIFVKADESLPYKEVYKILDELQASGFFQVSLIGKIE